VSQKRLIIASPDANERKRFVSLLADFADFRVISCTGDLMNTYNEVESQLPNAVLISDSLARLPEFEVMRALFSALDVRWLVLSSPHNTTSCLAPASQAASDLFEVPATAPDQVIEGQLRSLTRFGPSRASAQRPLATSSPVATAPLRATAVPARAPTPPSASANSKLILIGASTGGVDALLSVLSNFGPDCPPTLIVQHTGQGFGSSLADLLNRQCAPNVVLAKTDIPLRQGQIVIGAGSKRHLVLSGKGQLIAQCHDGPPMSGHTPSVDMLFNSAIDRAPQIAAALLTGMGRDGADGLLALKNAGAVTFAQDEASCVVYGMPRAAVELGAAQSVLPLDKLGQSLRAAQVQNTSPPREARA
jgi:two-component system chemotaxis response regulator CheB